MNSLNGSFKRVLFLCMVAVSCAHAMDEDDQTPPQSFMRNVAVGSAAGMTEALVNQPIAFVKNLLQQRGKEIKQQGVFKVLKEIAQKEPAQFYRGLGVNTACMVPTTAAQISISEQLKEVMPGEDIPTSLGRNAVAGAFSALTCNTSELIAVNQQNWKTSALNAAQRLHQENGFTVGFRGLMPKAARDAHFCAAFLTAYPMVQERLEQETGNPFVSTVLATAAVGPATAVVSHPYDTLSTRMQGDASQKTIRGFVDAAKTIYKEGGKEAFFEGLTPRVARLCIAIPLMTAVKNALSSDDKN